MPRLLLGLVVVEPVASGARNRYIFRNGLPERRRRYRCSAADDRERGEVASATRCERRQGAGGGRGANAKVGSAKEFEPRPPGEDQSLGGALEPKETAQARNRGLANSGGTSWRYARPRGRARGVHSQVEANNPHLSRRIEREPSSPKAGALVAGLIERRPGGRTRPSNEKIIGA